jgi:hypothetical protein
VADRLRDSEARAMGDHLRSRHVALGAILDRYRVTPTR